MTNSLWLLIVLLSLALFSCRKPIPDLKDFDRQTWQEDKNACNNTRSTLARSLEKQKEKLLALDEMEIVSVLGKPDRNELYKRNQKFYYYFIEPAENCLSPSNDAKVLIIRFNAMGMAKEISIE